MSTVSGEIWRAMSGAYADGVRRGEPKADPNYKRPEGLAHLNEDTGQPCPCNISAAQAERSYYQCTRVPKQERDRRAEAKDYATWTATPKGKAIGAANRRAAEPVEVVKPAEPDLTDRAKTKHLALCDGHMCERSWCQKGVEWRANKPEWRGRVDEMAKVVVRQGTPEDGRTGEGNAEQAERSVLVSVLPPTNRTGTEETDATAGQDTRPSAPTKTARKAQSVAERIKQIRERLRSGSQYDGQTDRTGSEVPDGAATMQTLQAQNPEGMGARPRQAVATAQPKKLRGRPRKHANRAEKQKVYRKRKALRK